MSAALTVFNVFKSIIVQAASATVVVVGAFYAQRALDVQQTADIETVRTTLVDYKQNAKENDEQIARDAKEWRDKVDARFDRLLENDIRLGSDLSELKGMLKNRGYGGR